MTRDDTLLDRARSALAACGATVPAGAGLTARSPIDGCDLLDVGTSSTDEVAAAVARAHDAFLQWRTVPAPVRGALVRRLGRLLEEHKGDLAELVTPLTATKPSSPTP